MPTLLEIRNEAYQRAYDSGEIRGTNADESITGTSYGEALCGEGGNDTVYGGGGNDWIEGCKGDDVLSGGPGCDWFQFYAYESHDVIRDFQNGMDYVEISFFGVDADDVTIAHGANRHVLTIPSHPEFSLVVIGQGFGIEDVLFTNEPWAA